jgi:hypothetical protein
MPRPEIRVVALFEDQAHECFVRHLFKRLGLRPVRYENCRNSAGVLQRLGAEVDELCARRHQKNLALVVVIDADEKGLRGRMVELARRVETDGQGGARKETDRIAYLVPALEIENWYVHLVFPEARPVDEARDYKPSREWRELAKDIGDSARRAVAEWPLSPSEVEPPSIIAALAELERVR